MDDNRIGDRVGKAADEARDRISAAAEAGSTIQKAAVETAKQISNAAAEAYRQGARAGKSVSQNTAEQPLLALLIAGAIGFGIAYMVYRR
jgi:hypothetical protein